MKTLQLIIKEIKQGDLKDGKLVILTSPVPEEYVTRAGNSTFTFPTLAAPNTASTRTSAERLYKDCGLQSILELKQFANSGAKLEFDVVEQQFGVTPITNATGEAILDPASGKPAIAGGRLSPERVKALGLKKGDTIHRLENVRIVLSEHAKAQVEQLTLNTIIEERKIRSKVEIDREFAQTNDLLARLASRNGVQFRPVTQPTAVETPETIKEVVDGS